MRLTAMLSVGCAAAVAIEAPDVDVAVLTVAPTLVTPGVVTPGAAPCAVPVPTFAGAVVVATFAGLVVAVVGGAVLGTFADVPGLVALALGC